GAWSRGASDANKDERRRLRDRIEAARRILADTVLRDLLLWLEAFRHDYEREKMRRGVLDFQDLLILARRLVQEDVGMRRQLGARIELLCVDEFQDTDPLQAELVLFLAEGEGTAARWQDVQVAPKLFLVGDPKQSIYRFRRADLDVYERCAEIVTRSNGLRLAIQRNFRSRPAILAWTNGVFASLFGAGDVAGPRHVARVGGPDALAMPAVWIVNGRASGEDAGLDRLRRDEARALAAFVGRALDDEWPVRDRDTIRPMQPRDAVLLFGRTASIEIYEAALQEAGLPFQQESGRLFFRRPEVRDVL